MTPEEKTLRAVALELYRDFVLRNPPGTKLSCLAARAFMHATAFVEVAARVEAGEIPEQIEQE